MKKRIIILGVCFAIAVCGIGVYASGLGDTIISKFAQASMKYVDENVLAFESENAERRNKIEAALNDMGDDAMQAVKTGSDEIVVPDKYSLMLAAMNATISDPIEYNDMLVNYEYLREVHGLSQEDMDYIADLIIDGCDMKEILNLTYFWVDTNDDISIIKSMYDLKGEYAGKKDWYGNAYDRVTNAKNGSLSVEEVEEYMSKGLTAEDILAADKLCRKGVYTINQILDKRCEGQNLVKIANEIENGGLIESTMFALEDEQDNIDYNAIENPYIIVDSKEAALLTGQSQSDVLKAAAIGEDVETSFHEKRSKKFSEILRNLEARGVTKEEPEVE